MTNPNFISPVIFQYNEPFSNDFRLHAIADKKKFYDSEKENEEKTTNRRWSISWGKDKIPILSKQQQSEMIDSKSIFTQPGSIDSSPTAPLKNTKNVYHVETLQEYKEVVANEKEAIVVVRFYAEWCKACKAIKPLFYRMAQTYTMPEYIKDPSTPTIKFVEVPLTHDNSILHQGLGVPSLPFGHIYHPGAGLVEERKIAKKNFKVFQDVLESYVDGYCNCDFIENEEGESVVLPLKA